MEYSEKIKVVKLPLNHFYSGPGYVFTIGFLHILNFLKMDSRI